MSRLRSQASLLWAAIGLALSLFPLGACSKSKGELTRDVAASKGILILGNEGEAPSLDPHLNMTLNGMNVINALLEGLIAVHPESDDTPEPGIAETWTHEGYQDWTFNLRRDSVWSNGDPVTAHDFVYSFQRILTPELGASYAEMLYVIKNAREFGRGEIKDFSKVGVKALDDHTLRIELIGPIPYFLNLLKHHAWYPVHAPTIEAAGGMAKLDSNWTRENYVCNGPFLLKEWTLNKQIVVVKNPKYWDADTVKLNEIRFLPIDDISAADQAFIAGDIHYNPVVPTDMITHYRKNEDPSLHVDPAYATYFYRFNVTSPPFNDVRVRKALNMAINRRAIVTRIMRGGQKPALSITPPGAAGYEPPTMEGFNPSRARELLAEAGYPNGKDFPKFTILFNTSEQHKAICETLAEMWKSILGLDVEIRNQEWKTFLESQNHLDYQVSRGGWFGDYAYPHTFLIMFRSTDGNNRTGWANPTYDALVESSFKETDAEKRLAILREAESILLDEAPIIPLYFYSHNYRLDPAVKNWGHSILSMVNYKYLHF